MKKIFISLGIIIVIFLLGAWGYLLIYGTPEGARDVFTRFEEGDGFSTTPLPADDLNTDIEFDTTPARLRQLTTRPVAGATFIERGIRYVEQGTGHIYDLDLETGERTLISGTTLPKATEAVFSLDGERVIISTLNEGGVRSVIADISTTTNESGSMEAVSLPNNITDFGFSQDYAYYLLKQPDGSIGYRYDPEDRTATTIFTLPLRDVRILWGDTIYAYTTPTAQQRGSVYRVGGNNTLSYVTTDGPGLVAVAYKNGVVATSIVDGELSSMALTTKGGRVAQSFPAIPEKCTQDPINPISLFCAVPTNITEGEFPDSWYMGKLSYTDTLWRFNTETGGASLLLDLSYESGRDMDVRAIGADKLGTRLFLVDKNDNTLWLFDRSIE